jgi:hypothetical protein
VCVCSGVRYVVSTVRTIGCYGDVCFLFFISRGGTPSRVP